MAPEDDRLRTLVHDLRTPLTVVSGFAELLVRRGAELDPAQRDEYLSRIVDGTREMRAILDQDRAAPEG
jgi:signal transduction histidine kinase